jgi:hypothetical protein
MIFVELIHPLKITSIWVSKLRCNASMDIFKKKERKKETNNKQTHKGQMAVSQRNRPFTSLDIISLGTCTHAIISGIGTIDRLMMLLGHALDLAPDLGHVPVLLFGSSDSGSGSGSRSGLLKVVGGAAEGVLAAGGRRRRGAGGALGVGVEGEVVLLGLVDDGA